MSQVSPVLALPFIQAAQAQKHVTHNEALQILDLAVQLAVESRSQADPPADPPGGTRHIVPAGATGAWAGQAGRVALHDGDAWRFADPRPGWTAHVLDEGTMVVFDGTGWTAPGLGATSADLLGINATADAVNRLTVAAEATLLNHDGAGHQLKLNKAQATDTASLLFQNGFSGRAEMGTMGGDNFSVKVSPDGASWHEALVANRTSGQVSLPNGLSVAGQITGTAVTQGTTDTTAGRLLKVGDGGLLSATPPAPPGNDFDTVDFLGLTQTFGAAVNKPAGNGWAILTLPRTASNRLQLAGRTDTALRYESLLQARQISSSGGVGAWVNIFHTRNIVGTVSESDGIPTGAVIQTGTGANGEFLRLAGRRQLCTAVIEGVVDITAASNLGTGFLSAPIEWPFPQPFAVDGDGFSPVVTAVSPEANPRSLVVQAAWAGPSSAVADRGIIRLWRGTSETASPYRLLVQAVGRW